MRLLSIFLLTFLSSALPAAAEEADIYLVSFTAQWCPNCKVLDPRIEEALASFPSSQISHVVLDMTNTQSKLASFEAVDGTLLAGVYGDHLGVTGIGILAAPDSGEKIGCVTREHSVEEITAIFQEARNIVLTQPPLQRQTGIGACPTANEKVEL